MSSHLDGSTVFIVSPGPLLASILEPFWHPVGSHELHYFFERGSRTHKCVTQVLHKCYTSVTRVLHKCYTNVTHVLHDSECVCQTAPTQKGAKTAPKWTAMGEYNIIWHCYFGDRDVHTYHQNSNA